MAVELGGRLVEAGHSAVCRWNPGTRKVVGAAGFEPATPCAQGRCATRLRYAPTSNRRDFTAYSNGTLLAAVRFCGESCPRTVPNTGLSQNPAFVRGPIQLPQRLTFHLEGRRFNDALFDHACPHVFL